MRSTKTLSRQRPLPSMLMAIRLSLSRPVKASLVNWLPWSVLNISGFSCLQSGFFQCLDAQASLHGDRQLPGQHAAAEPVHHRGQIDEAARHGDVGNVHGPDLVGPCDGQAAQQIRIDAMAGRGPGGAGPAIDGLDAHPSHQRAQMAPADLETLAAEQIAQHPAAGERVVQMQLVDLPHPPQVGFRDRPRLVVDAAAADAQRFRLLLDGKIMLGVDHRLALSNPALVSAPSKKSFSSVRAPILACSVFTSTASPHGTGLASPPNTLAAPSSNWLFHCVIWLGWMSNCSASSESVFSPRIAARATFDLNSAV